MIIEELIVVLVFLALFSIISYKLKLLDFEGVLIANAVGIAAVIYTPNPLICFAAVVTFFLIGELASNIKSKKHEQRTIWNVVGNSLPALVVIAMTAIYSEQAMLWQLAFFGAISAALSDTLSSEIGYFSKSKPIMITTFKKVPRGTDGGITLLGEIAALFGAIVIAALHFYAYSDVFSALIIIGAGMVGTNIDSLAGAIFETRKILNNTHVNLIGCASGAIFALLTGLFL
ncbi:MAG: DUF92 domain-containing protein [archaeon]